MLEPRRATAARARAAARRIASASSTAPGPKRAVGARRGRARRRRAPPAHRSRARARSRSGSPSPIPRRGRSRRPPRGSPSGRNRAYARPSRVAELGSAGQGVLHNRHRSWPRPTASAAGRRRLARLSARLPAERARPARDRRLRRDRARRASSARPPTSTPRTTSARAPRATWTASRARTERFEVIYASKAFPCTAAYRLLAEEGLRCDVASGGELYLALRGGFAPERIYMHGNNKSRGRARATRVEAGVGHIVVDSFDEIERLERIAPRPAA